MGVFLAKNRLYRVSSSSPRNHHEQEKLCHLGRGKPKDSIIDSFFSEPTAGVTVTFYVDRFYFFVERRNMCNVWIQEGHTVNFSIDPLCRVFESHYQLEALLLWLSIFLWRIFKDWSYLNYAETIHGLKHEIEAAIGAKGRHNHFFFNRQTAHLGYCKVGYGNHGWMKCSFIISLISEAFQ